jgi:hypothetical protein
MTYHGNSRRNFLKTLTTTALVAPSSLSVFANLTDKKNKGVFGGDAGTESAQSDMPGLNDGPASPLFEPLDIPGNSDISGLDLSLVSGNMAEAVKSAPRGKSVAWGIPFNINEQVIYLKNEPFTFKINPSSGKWIIFLHTSDKQDLKRNAAGFYEKPLTGIGQLNEEVARYIVIFEGGKEVILPIRQRYQIGMFQQDWGENCIESVAQHKPVPLSFNRVLTMDAWGWTQTRVSTEDRGTWINWLWAWENPEPGKKIQGFRFEPLKKNPIIVSAITVGNIKSNPLRWNTRQKAILSLPTGSVANALHEEKGELNNLRLDLGQIISAMPLAVYPQQDWPQSYNNMTPKRSETEIIVEFTAHPEARFHLSGQDPVPVSSLAGNTSGPGQMRAIKPADQRVKIRVVEKASRKVIPV